MSFRTALISTFALACLTFAPLSRADAATRYAEPAGDGPSPCLQSDPCNLETAVGRDQAYEEMLAWYVKEYGGEQVLLTPRSKATWIFPTLGVVGGLTLLLVVGWRFTTRGRSLAAANAPAASVVEDDEYADKLDDELSKAD